ncbi:glutathione S-transferase [Xylaria cf. heliscus]|nr:glutathione S-transferase [Xylaria cf. heliscus]
MRIYLEELAEAYGLSWTETPINISPNEQKKRWFPPPDADGRAPVLIDYKHSPPAIAYESSVGLRYLLNNEDKEKLGIEGELEENEMFKWLSFWRSSGPFHARLLTRPTEEELEKIEDATARFRYETLCVFRFLEMQLSGKYTGEPREYLAGGGRGKYSIADIKIWPWVSHWHMCDITQEQIEDFPHLLKWMGRIAQRPGSEYNPGEVWHFQSAGLSSSHVRFAGLGGFECRTAIML